MSNSFKYVERIQRSGLTIYDSIRVGDPELWIPTLDLQAILDRRLVGISVAGLPIRTRSKLVNQEICKALGYPVPKSFQRSRPRFPGQMFDKYVQEANNLQIWNEGLSPSRRYVLIRVNRGTISRVKVVTGDTLAPLDTTGTLTKKYQARCVPGTAPRELITEHDTERLRQLLRPRGRVDSSQTPITNPSSDSLLPIRELLKRLSPLIGRTFPDPGSNQERLRGERLHRFVCLALGYASFQENGQFPDIRNQLLEVKLQTSPTIDLGLVAPDNEDPLDVPIINDVQVRHCDVRYAVFFATTANKTVTITHLFLTTGERFFSRFPQFGGKKLNSKLQIPLPSDFFGR